MGEIVPQHSTFRQEEVSFSHFSNSAERTPYQPIWRNDALVLPERVTDLRDLLQLCITQGASDLHLTTHEPPVLRVDGQLRRLTMPSMPPETLKELIYRELIDPQIERFERELELDFALALPSRERFRVNLHQQRGSVEAAFRYVPREIPRIAELGLPVVAEDLARRPNGLVLITGPTGSGKTTTLAAIVNLINQEREALIMCIEDPIEFLHVNNQSIIKQREVGTDTHSFAGALKHAMRQDPDVIVVGEMRDLETISTTLTAAETGHLVLATLHTPDAPQTIARLIDVFPSAQQQQVKLQLADALQGIIAQQLIPRADETGRVLASEVLIATPAVRHLIREQEIEQIPSLMQTGAKYGMRTMDRSLQELATARLISERDARLKMRYPEDFQHS